MAVVKVEKMVEMKDNWRVARKAGQLAGKMAVWKVEQTVDSMVASMAD